MLILTSAAFDKIFDKRKYAVREDCWTLSPSLVGFRPLIQTIAALPGQIVRDARLVLPACRLSIPSLSVSSASTSPKPQPFLRIDHRPVPCRRKSRQSPKDARQHPCQAPNPESNGLTLLNANYSPLWIETLRTNGKYKKTDNVKNAFDRLRKKEGINKPLKSFKKTSATLVKGNERFNGLEDLFLGHAPKKMSDKHYTQVPGKLLDQAILWLETQYKIGKMEGGGDDSNSALGE